MESEKHAWNDFDSCNCLGLIFSVFPGNSNFKRKKQMEFFFSLSACFPRISLPLHAVPGQQPVRVPTA